MAKLKGGYIAADFSDIDLVYIDSDTNSYDISQKRFRELWDFLKICENNNKIGLITLKNSADIFNVFISPCTNDETTYKYFSFIYYDSFIRFDLYDGTLDNLESTLNIYITNLER